MIFSLYATLVNEHLTDVNVLKSFNFSIFCFTIKQLLVTKYFKGFFCLSNKDATCMITDKQNSYMKVHVNGCITEIYKQVTKGNCSF